MAVLAQAGLAVGAPHLVKPSHMTPVSVLA
jgi:hypothetical protein